MAVAFLAGCVSVYFLRRWRESDRQKSGMVFPVFSVSVGILTLLPLLAWLAGGTPTAMSVPELKVSIFKAG